MSFPHVVDVLNYDFNYFNVNIEKNDK